MLDMFKGMDGEDAKRHRRQQESRRVRGGKRGRCSVLTAGGVRSGKDREINRLAKIRASSYSEDDREISSTTLQISLLSVPSLARWRLALSYAHLKGLQQPPSLISFISMRII